MNLLKNPLCTNNSKEKNKLVMFPFLKKKTSDVPFFKEKN